MDRDSLNVTKLQFVKRIPKQNLSRFKGESLYVKSISTFSNNEVLLAVDNAALRVLSLVTEQLRFIIARDIAIQNVRRVAFDLHTDTLLLLMSDTSKYELVTLRRNASNTSEWLQVQRISTHILVTKYIYIAVCDSRVLLAESEKRRVYIFNVSAERTVSATSYVIADTIYGLACIPRDNFTLVAVSHSQSVSLHRPEQLARVVLTNPRELVFYKELLLVAHWNSTNGSDAVVSLRASGGALTEKRELLAAGVNVCVGAWALAGDQLVLWNTSSQDLLVYAFQ